MFEMTALLAQEAGGTGDYVSFPNIGIKIDPLISSFKIGPFTIHMYGIVICLGMVLCLVLGMRRAESYGISRNDLMDYFIWALPISIVGARLYYVIFSLDYYSKNPWEIIKIWNGGLAIYGAVIAIVIVAVVATKVKKRSLLHLLDFAMPYIMLGQGIGRWGNFFNQEAYGSETNTIFGMTGNVISKTMGDKLVHPTFLYESVWCILGFVFIVIYRKKFQKKVGEITALYMIVYGAERALVEGLRTDSLMLKIGSVDIRVSQWLSVALVVLGIALFIDAKVRGKKLTDVIEDANERGIVGVKKAKKEETGDTEEEESSLSRAAAILAEKPEDGAEEPDPETEEADEDSEAEESETEPEPEPEAEEPEPEPETEEDLPEERQED
ncbi:MAG: prolipoprotein diacylglyceryl transferase [Clostridia bacterium]|nr:prolipoprotein diacylglyceryl transferase [Clostridia bacterium]